MPNQNKHWEMHPTSGRIQTSALHFAECSKVDGNQFVRDFQTEFEQKVVRLVGNGRPWSTTPSLGNTPGGIERGRRGDAGLPPGWTSSQIVKEERGFSRGRGDSARQGRLARQELVFRYS